MTDTRYLYLKTTGQVYTNDTSTGGNKTQYMIMYDFDDLNGSLEVSGLRGGLVTNGNIMLFKPHDISLKILFDSREDRSYFAGQLYTITQIGYADNSQYSENEDHRIYWADCVVSSYVNNENPYINGFEQELKITVTTPWVGLVSSEASGETVTDEGTKRYNYQYAYTYGATTLDTPKLQLGYNTRFVIDYPQNASNVRYGYINQNGDRVEVLNFNVPDGFNDLLTIATDWTTTGKTSGNQSLSKFLGNIPIATIRSLTMADDYGVYPLVYFEFYNSAGTLLPFNYTKYQTQNFI